MPNKKRRRLKIAVRVLLVLLVLAVATVIAAKSWIIPGIIRDKVSNALAEHWGGEVEIEDVEFSFSGSAVLRNVKLLDYDGREWLHADNVAITLANWASDAPMLTDANIDGLDIFAHYVKGGCAPPLTESQKPADDEPKNIDLQSLTITNASFTKVDDGKWQPSEAFSLTLARAGDRYNLSYRQPGRKIAIDGEIVPNSFKNFALKNFTISTEHGELIRKLSANIITTKKDDQKVIEASKIYGITAGRGFLQGKAKLYLKPGEKPNLIGRLALGDAHLPALQKALLGKAEISSGTITIQAAFKCPGMQLENLDGIIAIFVDDIDSHNHGLTKGTREFIGIQTDDTGELADIEAVFDIKGLKLILKQGCHYTSSLFAVEGEPGGTINLMTKEIDVYIVAAQISQLRNVFSAIPIKLPLLPNGILTNLLKKMFRLHLLGKWDDPAEKLIRKEPISDLAKGTVEFLKTSVEGGGQLGGDVLNLFSELSKGFNGNGSETKNGNQTKPKD